MFHPCCCISLRTGALIVAAAEILIAFITVGFCILGLSEEHTTRRVWEKASDLIPGSSSTSEEGKVLMGTILLTLMLVLGVTRFVAAFLLVQSVIKKKPSRTYPYLIFCGLTVVCQIYSLATWKIDWEGIMGLAVAVWFWLSAYYCKKDIDDCGDGMEDGKC